MKVIAWSDGHGLLPKIKEYTDVVIIAGDVIPLQMQKDTQESLKWFCNEFFKYVKKCNCKKVIMTPGNHDFVLENISPETIKGIIANDPEIKDKLVYLIDETYEYKGYKFYGTPWVTALPNWAFYTDKPAETFNRIPVDTDILISHMPPKIDKLGCSYPYQSCEQNYGSDSLREVLANRNIKYHFCGHVHSGLHGGIQFEKTMIYNVSLMNEDYQEAYKLTEVEI